MNARLFCRILEGFVDEAHNCHSIAPGVFKIDGCLAIARHYQGERLVKPPTAIVLLLLTTACYFKVFLLKNFFFHGPVRSVAMEKHFGHLERIVFRLDIVQY